MKQDLFIEASADAPRYFADQSGKGWIPIGCNLCFDRLYDADTEGVLLHDALFAPFFAGAAGCGQFWHWDSYIARHGLWRHFRLFAKAVEGLDPVAEKFRPFHTETRQVRVWGLRGRRTTVVWCRDKSSTWESELRRGLPAEEVCGTELPFDSNEGFAVYLPWEDRSIDLPAGRCRLPPFRRSCVVRFTDGSDADIGVQREI